MVGDDDYLDRVWDQAEKLHNNNLRAEMETPARRENDQQLGYMIGKMEALELEISELKSDMKVLVNRFEALDDHIRTARGVISTIKLVLVTIIGIVTWRFDAVRAAWLVFWKT